MERVVRKGVDVGSDQRPQILAKGDVDGGAIVERADAHRKHLSCSLDRFIGQAVDQAGMQGARWQDACTACCELDEVLGAARDDRQKRLVDGEDQNGAAVMGFQ